MRLSLPLLALLALLGAPALAGDAEPDATRLGRILVSGDDLYRLTPEQLRTLDIADGAQADVRQAGKPVPVWRNVTVDGVGGCVVFAARDTVNAHSAWSVFGLHRRPAPAGPDAGTGTGTGTGTGADATFPLARELVQDRVLGELGAADPDVYAHDEVPVWFLGFAPPGQVMPARLGPMGARAGTLQRLVARVYATWHGRVDMDATWGGHSLGRASVADAVGGADLTWHVAAGAVPPEVADIHLRNVSPPPPPPPTRDDSAARGTIYVDRIRLEGEAEHVRRIEDARPCLVEAVRLVPDPALACRDAQHVILAVPPLVAEARRLAAHRTQRGLSSQVVDVTHVYERYGHGEHGPEAILRFLTALRTAPNAPLSYVLLAGDATFDRTDLVKEVTIPTPMTRSMYNGATSSDRAYLTPTTGGGEPALGRLPFRTAETMRAYVDRVIRYETKPPADASRRVLRFITSEGRFSPFIDNLIEGKFRNVLAHGVPPAFDVEVTYANPRSPYLWPPPELSSKVIAGLNDGALFYTYVGHGFEKGFDTLQVGTQRYGILHAGDAERVDIRHTPPVVFVLACTTAMFDGLRGDGIGEALMKRPSGPIAYWGASRICHPVYNAFIGEAVARNLGTDPRLRRIGDLLARARAEAPTLAGSTIRGALQLLAGVRDFDRLFAEGDAMYTLLGDPALEIAFPRGDIDVRATLDAAARSITAEVRTDLPDGTPMQVALEVPRNVDHATLEGITDPGDPASFPAIRRNHARVNDLALARKTLSLTGGRLEVRFDVPEGVATEGLVVKAWCIAKGDVWQGAAVLP